MASQSAPRPHSSVIQDWSSPLSTAHDESFLRIVHQLETAYWMWSVNLDEALGLRRTGRGSKASLVLGISPALCDRLSYPLLGSLRAMLFHTLHFGTSPNLAPLAAYNFQLVSSQRAARFNSLFSKLLLTHKSQFQYKLSVLVELVADLSSSYVQASEELNEGISIEEDQDWEALQASHYDLNTCLQETIVLLKSFLLALPDTQLKEFNLSLQQQMASSPGLSASLSRNLAHRRVTVIKGQ
jgi:hypothetical protein